MSELHQKPPSFRPLIHIPFIKRHTHTVLSNHKQPNASHQLALEDHFRTLKNQLQDHKSQLDLTNNNSRFTKVSSTDCESPSSIQSQNTHPTFLPQSFSLQNLQAILQFIEKSDVLEQSEQKQFAISTKNILRNICNAQNQFIIFNNEAELIINSHLKDPSKFKKWVNHLKFHTFEEFQRVWTCKRKGVFTKLYKKLCRKFYLENAIPYIINSRIKNKETKKAHIRYLYRFLEGLENPEGFFYFKQKEKEKVDGVKMVGEEEN